MPVINACMTEYKAITGGLKAMHCIYKTHRCHLCCQYQGLEIR